MVRPVYFMILITHIILAGAAVPLAIFTYPRAARPLRQHRQNRALGLAGLDVCVSVTGVIVYLMVYIIY